MVHNQSYYKISHAKQLLNVCTYIASIDRSTLLTCNPRVYTDSFIRTGLIDLHCLHTLPRSNYTHDEKCLYTLPRSYLGVAAEEEEEEADVRGRAVVAEEEEAGVCSRAMVVEEEEADVRTR
jgi:hypothetical protein